MRLIPELPKRLPAALLLTAALALACAGRAAAEGWTLNVKAVNGRFTYSYSLPCAEDKPAEYSGRPKMRGGGPAREIVFKSLLSAGEGGSLRLNYDLTVAGERGIRAPFQAAGKLPLRPGRPLLAAEAGGWKLILELQGEESGVARQERAGTLETRLKCGRNSYPASFVYLPDKQYSAVLYGGSDDKVGKFMVGLLPGSPGLDGTFLLQYTLLLKDGSETLAEGQGKFILEPGGAKRTASAGSCVFSARALR